MTPTPDDWAELRKVTAAAREYEAPWELVTVRLAPAARAYMRALPPDRILRLLDERDRLREAVEGMAYQFGYWSDTVGGIGTGGLSALEDAFEALGWDDPRPVPEMRCDEPGCMQQITTGWPTRPGGTGSNGGYRRTCHEHWCAANPGSCRSHPAAARALLASTVPAGGEDRE